MHDEEIRAHTLSSGRWANLFVELGLLGWIPFDHLVDPAEANLFLATRLIAALLVALLSAALFTPWGSRHPAPFIFGVLGITNASVAFMVSRAGDVAGIYAMGMTLVISASVSILVWSWRWTMATSGLAWLAIAVAVPLAPRPPTGHSLAAVAFIIVTASLVASAGQRVRDLATWREFHARRELEHEQRHSKRLLEALARVSREDALTGIANRRAWDEQLARECERAGRRGAELAVILGDLDGLKPVNDQLGHASGDRVLEAVARALTAVVRGGDLVARLGGDEYGVICPDTDLTAASLLAERIREAIAELALPELEPGQITISVGVAGHEPDDSPSALMDRADTRMYLAKRRRDPAAAQRVLR